MFFYYLFEADLQYALQSGCLNNSNKIISKDNKGLYLVVFKVLNLKKILVFNLIYYPIIFREVLLYYLLKKRYGIYNSLVYREMGDILGIYD